MKPGPKVEIFWCYQMNKKQSGKKTAKDTGCQKFGCITLTEAPSFLVFSAVMPLS